MFSFLNITANKVVPVVVNEWRREALKRSFYGDSDMQMCHSLTYSLTHSLTHSGVDTGMVGMATAQSEPDGILK